MRPTTFEDIIGQTEAKDILQIAVKSATEREAALPHILMHGPAGTGKTTFANAIANDFDTKILIANGVNLTNAKAILPYLARMKHRSILFIDEIHRIRTNIQEMMYEVMEDFQLTVGKKAVSRMQMKPFTVIGATTDPGLLLKPFRDRFKYNVRLTTYNDDEIAEIIAAYSLKLGLEMTEDCIRNLASRCRGTPRIAIGHLEWVRDYCISKEITRPVVSDINEAMSIRGVTSDGMTHDDRTYLAVLRQFGGPVGLKTLASALDKDPATIETVIEPFLIKQGRIQKTSRGRQIV